MHNAWLRTIEDGIHTYDIFNEGASKQKVGTKEFAAGRGRAPGAEAQDPQAVALRAEAAARQQPLAQRVRQPEKGDLVGVDIYVDWPTLDNANDLGRAAAEPPGDGLALNMISNRGVKVWPDGHPETFCTDNFRCRFMSLRNSDPTQIIGLLDRVAAPGLEIVKTENLRNFDGKPGFTLAQGQ